MEGSPHKEFKPYISPEITNIECVVAYDINSSISMLVSLCTVSRLGLVGFHYAPILCVDVWL